MSAQTIAEIKDSYMKALLAGDAEDAHRSIQRGLASGHLPTRLYSQVLIRSQSDLEQRAVRNEISQAQEQVGSQITLQEMGRLRDAPRSRIKVGLKAAVTSLKGDRHLIAAQSNADFLIMDGWTIDFLGIETENDDLSQFVQDRKSDLVCISISSEESIATAKAVIARLRELSKPPKVIICSRGLQPTVTASVGADGVSFDPEETVKLARQLCGLLSSENALAIYLRKLGLTVHEYRKLRGMSQQELAESAHIDRAYISSVENGKQNISIGAISKLAKALSISIEELLVDGKHCDQP